MFKLTRSALSYRIAYVTEVKSARNFSNIVLRSRNVCKVRAAGATFVRFSSSDNSTLKNPGEALLDQIPEPPPAPPADLFTQEIVEAVNALSANGEPTFASLGLGGWGPVGLVQKAMEFLHVSLDIPWWGTIVIGTICVRILIFPLVLMSQRNAAKLTNNLPEMQTIQIKMTEARRSGNQLEAARYSHELMLFMKERGLSPAKNMLVPIAQAPLFISFFIGLRGMANCPVESMTQGGLWWFADLTVPDQYYILPIITSATMLATIELGVDGSKLNQNMGLLKYFLRAVPLIMLPFTVNFPGAILCYWVSTNFVSLLQVGLLKIPAVRDFCKIPRAIQHKKEDLPYQSQGFLKDTKNSWQNMKISRELQDRAQVDEMLFNQAGKAPLQKTYKFDPTKTTFSMQPKKP